MFYDTKSDEFTIYCDLKKHIKFDYIVKEEKTNKVISLKRKFFVDSKKKMFVINDFFPYFKKDEVSNFKYLDSLIYRKIERKNNKNKRIFLDELTLKRDTGDIKIYERVTGYGLNNIDFDFSNTWYGICEIFDSKNFN